MSGTDGMVTISATQLQQERNMLALFDKVWNDPNIGEGVRRKAKEFNPNLVIPDDHPVAVAARTQVSALTEQLTTLKTEFEGSKAERERERAEANLRKQLGDVQSRFHLTDEGMAKTIEIMQQRQLADPEAAALLYRESIPKTPPTSASSRMFDTKMDMYGTTRKDAQWEKLHTDEAGFFADVVNEVFSELPVGS